MPVREHHVAAADLEMAVHDLVRHARGRHAGIGAVLVAHEPDHFRADRAAVELDRLVTAAVEEEIRLDLRLGCVHRPSFGVRYAEPHGLAYTSNDRGPDRQLD